MKILLQKSRVLLLERGREQGRDKAAFQRKDTDCSIQVRGTLMNELMLYDSKEKRKKRQVLYVARTLQVQDHCSLTVGTDLQSNCSKRPLLTMSANILTNVKVKWRKWITLSCVVWQQLPEVAEPQFLCFWALYPIWLNQKDLSRLVSGTGRTTDRCLLLWLEYDDQYGMKCLAKGNTGTRLKWKPWRYCWKRRSCVELCKLIFGKLLERGSISSQPLWLTSSSQSACMVSTKNRFWNDVHIFRRQMLHQSFL